MINIKMNYSNRLLNLSAIANRLKETSALLRPTHKILPPTIQSYINIIRNYICFTYFHFKAICLYNLSICKTNIMTIMSAAKSLALRVNSRQSRSNKRVLPMISTLALAPVFIVQFNPFSSKKRICDNLINYHLTDLKLSLSSNNSFSF